LKHKGLWLSDAGIDRLVVAGRSRYLCCWPLRFQALWATSNFIRVTAAELHGQMWIAGFIDQPRQHLL
jgi:hypothetical protein